MTIQTVPGTDLVYYLVSYDKDGVERNDDPQGDYGLLSKVILKKLDTDPSITDVFFMSHGWMGQMQSAKDQYDAWAGAMAACTADLAAIRAVRPAFKPLLIGLHWPSLPWGDESHGAAGVDYSPGAIGSLDALIDDAADKIADTEKAREALRILFTAALEDIEPERLPTEVIDAYRTLIAEAGLEAHGPGGDPGTDAEPFDPEEAYRQAREEEDLAFGGSILGGILAPLRNLSFWTMKKRGLHFGEQGAAWLLRKILAMDTLPGQPRRRVHLMGHSFGCIVVSGAVAGGGQPLARPVDTLFLVQGALSLWAYCADIPVAPGTAGYFHPIAAKGLVRGPLLTTRSVHDSAVGTWYPLAAGALDQLAYEAAAPPRYGAVGAYGLHGPGVNADDLPMRPADEPYALQAGAVYNIDGSEYICEGGGFSGAHSDIAKPEVAHAFWQAVLWAATTD